MRIVLLLLIILHGLIHLLGFAKAFQFGEMEQFTKEISRPMGILWFLAALFFIVTALGLLLRKDWWPLLGIVVVILSQSLIFTTWADAKYGTIANVIIMVVAIVGMSNLIFERGFKEDVAFAMNIKAPTPVLLTEEDLAPLPRCVQKYLVYVGAVGKPKINNVKIVFKGEMRDKGKDWFSMQIKLLSLFSVVDLAEPELYPTETVTFFNDLCLFAPAALIDDRISWETLDNLSAKATFNNNGTIISAILYFNEKGQLVNFVSNDRYSVSEMKAFPFSTPAGNYKNVNGYQLPTYGEATWHYPDGEFVYGKFEVVDIAYNVID